MNVRSSLWAGLFAGMLALSALGCGRAFRDAMTEGDAHAQQGNWDAAAASYERAVHLDPDSEEAQAKWLDARRRQAAIRTSQSQAHLARGEFAQAVRTAHQAVRLDPQNAAAQAAYAEARARAFAQSEALLGQGKPQEALELVQVLRQVDPNDRAAAELEGRCLDRIAAGAYDRAIAYIGRKKLGNALLALNEAEKARPGYRDARTRLLDVRIQLEDEIRLVIQVVRAPEGERNALAVLVEERLLRWEPDARFRLSAATDREPRAGAQFVRIFPKFSAVQRGHDMTAVGRSCTYVCGVDRVPNPEHEAASRRANEAERQMQSAEGRLRRARKQAAVEKQALATATKDRTAAEAKEKTAEDALNACRLKKKAGGDCSVEEAAADAAQHEREAAAERETQAKQAQTQAELEVGEAETEVAHARTHWNRMVNELSNTPTTVQVNRICTHNYGVEVHTFTASSVMSLRVHVTGDDAPVDLPPKLMKLSQTDETFPAFPGRCEEVAAGDPLKAPTDSDLDAALANQSVEQIRTRVAEWYGLYVDSYRADESNARANGNIEDANEAYIRHRLLGPGLAY